MPDQPTPEQVEQIADALAEGRKIEAIKIYREATGRGLKEAKEFVDALIPKLKEQDPERFAKLGESRGVGCASVVILCAVAIGGLLAASCSRDSETASRSAKPSETTLQFRIALSTTPFKAGDTLASKEYIVVNTHTLSLPVSAERGYAQSTVDGVVLEATWDSIRIAGRRSERYLSAKGFRYRVRNRLVMPNRDRRSYGWMKHASFGPEWDWSVSPVSIDPGNPQSPQLCLQWRWSNGETASVKDFRIKLPTGGVAPRHTGAQASARR